MLLLLYVVVMKSLLAYQSMYGMPRCGTTYDHVELDDDSTASGRSARGLSGRGCDADELISEVEYESPLVSLAELISP